MNRRSVLARLAVVFFVLVGLVPLGVAPALAAAFPAHASIASAPRLNASGLQASALLQATAALTATAAPVATPTEIVSSGLLFDDDFGSLQRSMANGWQFGASASSGATWTPYVQTITETVASHYMPSFAGGNYADFGVLADVQPVGPGYAEYGLVFRWSSDSSGGNDTGYQFTVTTSGTYRLYKSVGGKWVEPALVPSASSTYIKQGNVRNVLAVIAQGNSLSLYINGTRVNSVTDNSAAIGHIGVFAATQDQPPAMVNYFRVSVFTPDRAAADWGGATTSTGAPTGISQGILFQDDFSSQQASISKGWQFPSGSGYSFTWSPGANTGTEANANRFLVDNPTGTWDNLGAEAVAASSGTGYAQYGIMLRETYSSTNGYTGYVFSIDTNGKYWLSKIINGTWASGYLLNGTASQIQAGNGQNVLRVLADGPQLSAFINDVQVGSVTDSDIKSGSVGLYVGSNSNPPATVAFHSLRVLTPAAASQAWSSAGSATGTPGAQSTSSAASTPAAQSSGGGALFHDDFSSQQASQSKGWTFGAGQGYTIAWTPGAQVITVSGANQYQVSMPVGLAVDNFGAETTANPTGNGYAEYGLAFRVTSAGNASSGYAFVVSSDGRYALIKSVNGTWVSDVISPTTTTALKQGSAPNTLRVLAQGPQITLFINGTAVASATDSTLTSGSLGFYVAARNAPPASVAFHNLTVLPAGTAMVQWLLPSLQGAVTPTP
jgi:hypothetical protein